MEPSPTLIRIPSPKPLLGATAAVAIACASPTSITGDAVNTATGRPVAGVTVTLSGTTIAAMTDEQGHYRLAEVPPGTQTLTVKNENWLVLSAPTLTVAEGSTVPAAALELFPKPPSSGLWSLSAGAFTSLPDPPHSEVLNGGILAYSGAFKMSVTEHLPDVEPPVDLVLSYPAPTSELTVRRYVRRNPTNDFSMRYPARYEPELRNFAGFRIGGIGEGIHRIQAASPEPGVYSVRQEQGRSAKIWLFEVVASPPTVEVRDGVSRLVAPSPGKWSLDTDAWKRARDLAVTWCKSGGCSEAQISALNDASATGSPACLGSLNVTGHSVWLSTWECNGGLVVNFRKLDDGWVPENAFEEESGD